MCVENQKNEWLEPDGLKAETAHFWYLQGKLGKWSFCVMNVFFSSAEVGI